MAGRRPTPPKTVTFAQTPDAGDAKVQRAFDVINRAIHELQAKLGGTIDVFTATADGLTPASGGSATDFLSADGTWKSVIGSGLVDSVTGSAPITAAPTTGAVIVSLDNNGVSDIKLRDSAALSVIGRATNSTGDPADIAAGSDGDVLRRSGVTLGFGAIPESSVTNLTADLAARPTGSGTGGRSTRWSAGTVLATGAFVDDGTNVSLAGTLTLSTFTAGSVLFAGASGLVSQDNAHIFWDNANDALTVTTTTSSSAIQAINADAVAGAMNIRNTNASGPVDFYALDSGGTARMSWGYGNASYSDTARVGRGYVWRNTGIDFVFARTNIVDGIIKSDGKWGIGTATSLTALLEINASTPDVFINGATSSLLRYSTNGLAVPAFTTRSAGTKIVLYPSIDGSNVDFAIGLASGELWQSVAQSTAGQKFTWYGGTTQVMSLTATGNLSAVGSVTLGDGSTDAHTLNGNITLANAPTAGTFKVGSANARIFLARQVLTASSGTYTPTTGAKAVRIRLVGGGGGGGGALGAAGVSDGWAGGGASGAYIEKWIDPAASVTGGAFACGAAGAAGTATPGNGGTGGDTTIVVQGTTYTAKGGTGGALMNAAVAATVVAGGAIQAGSSAADVSFAGAPGEAGVAINITTGHAGNGGSSPFGAGGPGSVTDAAGTAGSGNGSGGGGAGATTVTGRAGGAGTIGIIIVDEYA